MPQVDFSFGTALKNGRIVKVKKGEKRKKTGRKMSAVQVHRYRYWLGSKFRQLKADKVA